MPITGRGCPLVQFYVKHDKFEVCFKILQNIFGGFWLKQFKIEANVFIVKYFNQLSGSSSSRTVYSQMI